MIVTNDQAYLVHWLCERIGLTPSSDCKAIGSVSSDWQRLRGVVGYDSYNGASVVMHMAGEPGWIDKAMLAAAFDYPFNVMGCTQVLASLPASKTRALDINKRLGFEVVLELPAAHPDGALILMRMWREQCKWLAPRRTH